MKQLLASLTIALTAVLALAEAQAAVTPGSPDALLSADDRRYQEQAVQNALEFNRTGQTEAWENPATGNRGRVTPIQTYRDSAGRDCRKYDRVFSINGRQAQGWGTRCRTAAGTWLRPFAPRPVYVYHHYYRPYPYAYYRPYPYYYPYHWPVSFHLFYRFGGHRHHHHRRHWRRH